MVSELKAALMQRDDLSEQEADEIIADSKQQIREGVDPQEVLDELGLECDYIMDLL